jgi:hypothetical protein
MIEEPSQFGERMKNTFFFSDGQKESANKSAMGSRKPQTKHRKQTTNIQK